MAKLQTKYSLSPLPVRRQTRLGSYDYRQAGGYFVTICAHNRRCLFGAVADGIMLPNESGRVLIECWQALPAHFSYVQLDEFVVMPNHFHAILFINDGDVGARHASPAQVIGTNKASLGTEIREYVTNNPMAWELDELNPQRARRASPLHSGD